MEKATNLQANFQPLQIFAHDIAKLQEYFRASKQHRKTPRKKRLNSYKKIQYAIADDYFRYLFLLVNATQN